MLLLLRLIDYGLRDYGTAKWEGGDPNCEHKQYLGEHNPEVSPKQLSSQGTQQYNYRNKCAKCGAVRIDQQIGLEQTPDEYVADLVQVFREVWRVLRDDGVAWLNLGDSYSSYKDCKSVPDSLRVGGRSESANSIEKGMSVTRNTKVMRSVGLKDKDLIGIPWMVAFALRADGWYLRQDIIWAKPNPMPESVKDRCTKAHEYVFLLSKSSRYYYDYEAVLEPATGFDGRKDTLMKGSHKYANGFVPNQQPQTVAVKGHERWRRKNDGTNYGGDGAGFQDHSGYSNLENPYVRNRRSVWTVPTRPYKGAHYATFPPDLIKPMILAGCPAGGIVLDPFVGSGTTVMVANELGRRGIGLDLNMKYLDVNARERLASVQPLIFA